MNTTVNTNDETDDDGKPWLRRLVVWGVPLIAVGVGVYLYGSAGRYVSTDNAYLQQDRIDVAAQIAGNVLKVYVNENAHVTAGQPLFQLDDALLKIAVTVAETQLASARSEVASLQAAYREKEGEMAVARRAAEFSTREFKRQLELADKKLVSVSSLDTADRAAQLSTGAIDVLTLQRDQTAARLGGKPNLPLDSYTQVRTAAAELERTKIDLQHTLVSAPQSGIVSHLPKVGSRVDIGRAACAIVSDHGIWVEANFKETDLEWVRPGQPVRIDVDTYAQHRWSGRVESVAQATGAEFSLLPAQNATGNWVKVVQRVPVRIALDLRPQDPPLRDGMSANVEIDAGPHSRFDRWFGARR